MNAKQKIFWKEVLKWTIFSVIINIPIIITTWGRDDMALRVTQCVIIVMSIAFGVAFGAYEYRKVGRKVK